MSVRTVPNMAIQRIIRLGANPAYILDNERMSTWKCFLFWLVGWVLKIIASLMFLTCRVQVFGQAIEKEYLAKHKGKGLLYASDEACEILRKELDLRLCRMMYQTDHFFHLSGVTDPRGIAVPEPVPMTETPIKD